MPKPHRIMALIPDLMAEVRFTEAMRAAGLKATLLTAADWPVALEPTGANPPEPFDAAVIDLTAPSSLEALTTAVAAGVPVLAYGPHVQADALGAAREAGATLVVPRGRFVREAAALLTNMIEDRTGELPRA